MSPHFVDKLRNRNCSKEPFGIVPTCSGPSRPDEKVQILVNFEKRLEDREPCHYICTKQDGWLRPGGLAAIRRIVSDDIKSTKNEIKKDLANKLSSY